MHDIRYALCVPSREDTALSGLGPNNIIPQLSWLTNSYFFSLHFPIPVEAQQIIKENRVS